jgi:hypothetical protein
MQHVPLDGLPSAWRRLVKPPRATEVDRPASTLCTLERLPDHLRRRDVLVTRSERWGNPRLKLLHGAHWETMRPHVCRALNRHESPEPELHTLAQALGRFLEKKLLCESQRARMRLEVGGAHLRSRGPIMCRRDATLACQPLRSASHIAARRLAASQLRGPTRRACEAERALNHGGGTPLLAATLLGWGRQTVARGLAERRTGSLGLGAPSAFRGRQRWEARPPPGAEALRQLAEAPAPHAPTFRTSVTSTRLTAQAAVKALREPGESEAPWPSPRTLAEVVQRRGWRLRKVVQATPHKQRPEPDALCDKIKQRGASRVIRQRQTRAEGWESSCEHRRRCTRWSHPGRPPRP